MSEGNIVDSRETMAMTKQPSNSALISSTNLAIREFPATDSPKGNTHFLLSYRMLIVSWFGLFLLQAALFFRLNPYGTPYIFNWQKYFFRAIFYDLFGAFLLGFPFLALWLIRYRIMTPFTPWRYIHVLQIVLLTGNLLLSHVDHEIIRFMGTHLTFSFIQTYVHLPNIKQPMVYSALLADSGGPGLSLVIAFIVPGLYLLWAVRHCRHSLARLASPYIPFSLALVLALGPLLVTGFSWWLEKRPLIKEKVRPYVLVFSHELKDEFKTPVRPADYEKLVSRYQEMWLKGNADVGWRFSNPDYPYLRSPIGDPSPVERKQWNIVFVQLECFRGWDTGFLRPDQVQTASPYLDSLAKSGQAAFWTRCLSFGPPTVSNFVAAHCSITPHSRRILTTTFITTDLYAFPQALRKKGYQTEFFTVCDPDWDNETIWLSRWYEQVSYQPEKKNLDREIFRAAAERLREVGRGSRPFLMTVVSGVNHYPFKSPEAEFEVSGDVGVSQKILGTMRYTDDVVKEFIEGLRTEPWFEKTIFVIFGDHGYNLGEHSGNPGQINLYRESLWVPFIIYGNHPRLPRGPQVGICSLLDIAPTVADLLGIREPNPWQGHSLVTGRRSEAVFTFVKGNGTLAYAETDRFTIFTDPKATPPLIFNALNDPLQRKVLLPSEAPGVLSLLTDAHNMTKLNDYLISSNKVWRSF